MLSAVKENIQDNVAHLIGKNMCMEESLLGIIDTFDRPGNSAGAHGYAGVGACVNLYENRPGERLPKAELYATAGVGYFRIERSVFGAEAKGPNVGAVAGLSTGHGARAFVKAGVASASASAGPLKATVGLAFDTGVGISLTGVEVRALGTGISIGSKISISLLGNSIEFNFF